jgi:hypothetical protein
LGHRTHGTEDLDREQLGLRCAFAQRFLQCGQGSAARLDQLAYGRLRNGGIRALRPLE